MSNIGDMIKNAQTAAAAGSSERMTEEDVHNEWEAANIGRDITQEEVENWARFGVKGQLLGELGREGNSEEARATSNTYHQALGKWDKVVNIATGDPISGWRDPKTGNISIDPMAGFEDAEPIWGENGAIIAKRDRAISLFDEQSITDNFDLDTGVFGGEMAVEGDWIAIPTGVQVNEDRLSTVSSNGEVIKFKDANGVERTMYQKVSKKKKYGAIGEVVDKLPGDIKDLVAGVTDIVGLGFGDQLIGGTELSSRSAATLSNLTGIDEKTVQSVQSAIPTVAAAVVGAATAQLWLPAAVQTLQKTGNAATAEAQGYDVDWAKTAENTLENAAWSLASAYTGGAAKLGIVGMRAGAKSGGDWAEVGEAVASNLVAQEAGGVAGVGGAAAASFGTTRLRGGSVEEAILQSSATYIAGDAATKDRADLPSLTNPKLKFNLYESITQQENFKIPKKKSGG